MIALTAAFILYDQIQGYTSAFVSVVKIELSITLILVAVVTVPITFIGLEALSYQGTTTEAEFSAATFASTTLNEPWTSDDHITRVENNYYGSDPNAGPSLVSNWLQGGDPPMKANGVRQLRETYFTATQRLQKPGSERIAESYGDSLWRQIDDIPHTVTSEVVVYADQFENPVLVLEDLTHICENMDYGSFMNRRLHGWGFAKMHAQLRYKAAEKGIRVKTVNPAYTSKSCHCCGERGTRPVQATFRCTNPECWVSEYQADVNAALNIADRYLSGESHLREHTGDNDSAEDGAV